MRVIDIRWHLWALGERATGYQQWQRDEQQKRLDPRSGSDVRSDSLSESVATFLSHSVILVPTGCRQGPPARRLRSQTSLSRPDAYLCSKLEISVWYGRPSASARFWIASRSLLDNRMFSRRSLRNVAFA